MFPVALDHQHAQGEAGQEELLRWLMVVGGWWWVCVGGLLSQSVSPSVGRAFDEPPACVGRRVGSVVLHVYTSEHTHPKSTHDKFVEAPGNQLSSVWMCVCM